MAEAQAALGMGTAGARAPLPWRVKGVLGLYAVVVVVGGAVCIIGLGSEIMGLVSSGAFTASPVPSPAPYAPYASAAPSAPPPYAPPSAPVVAPAPVAPAPPDTPQRADLTRWTAALTAAGYRIDTGSTMEPSSQDLGSLWVNIAGGSYHVGGYDFARESTGDGIANRVGDRVAVLVSYVPTEGDGNAEAARIADAVLHAAPTSGRALGSAVHGAGFHVTEPATDDYGADENGAPRSFSVIAERGTDFLAVTIYEWSVIAAHRTDTDLRRDGDRVVYVEALEGAGGDAAGARRIAELIQAH